MNKIIIMLLMIFSSLQAKDLTKVSLQLKWKYQFQFAGFIIAKEKGFYKDVGLDMDILEYSDKTHIVKDIEEGKVDFGVSDSALILESVKGLPIVGLMAIYQRSPYILMGLKSSNINKLSDVNGKRIAIYNDINGKALESMLKLHNIDFIKKPISNKLEKLKNHEIDLAISYISNEPYLAKKMGMDITIIDPLDYGFERYGDILFTLQKTVQDNPKLVQKMYEASKKGFEYAFTHIEEVVDIIHSKYNTQNKTKEALLNEANILKNMTGIGTNFGELIQSKVDSIAYIYSYSGIVKYNQENLSKFIYKPLPTSDIKFTLKEKEYLEAKKEITMCVDPDWLPFEKINKDGKYIGILSEYISYFSKKLNIQFKLIPTKSYSESLVFLNNKKCDIIAGDGVSNETVKGYFATKPYFITQRAFSINADTKGVQDISQVVYDGKIGVLLNAPIASILQKRYKDIEIAYYSNSLDGLTAVSKKEIVAYIEPISSLAYNIQINGLENVHIGGILKPNIKLSVIINKNEPFLVSILNKAIDTISENQRIGILNKWIKVTYKKDIDYTLLWEVILVFTVIFVILFLSYIKQKKLQKKILLLNNNLEERVTIEVEKNRDKDKLMLTQSRRAQMGEMISMIAHQWRQPLNSLSLLNQTILLKYTRDKLDDESVEYFKVNSQKQITEMSKTIDDFRNFFKPQKTKIAFCFNTMIEDTLSMVRPIFGHANININLNITDEYSVLGYPNELGQALINILNNAKDALIENNIENKKVSINLLKIDDKIQIVISDNAGGIPADIIDNIFDPYFSTKSEKNGTGLGLYMTKIIIEKHMNAKINVSNTDVGAVFTITFTEDILGEKNTNI